jgi:hypothetical protein
MTLMPVSKISVLGSRSVNFGVSRWIGQRSTSSGRSGNRVAGVGDLHAAAHPVRAAHRHRAHLVLPDMLLHLGGEPHRKAAAAVLELQGVVDLGQVLRLELHVEHRADDLHHPAHVLRGGAGGRLFGCDRCGHLLSLLSFV